MNYIFHAMMGPNPKIQWARLSSSNRILMTGSWPIGVDQGHGPPNQIDKHPIFSWCTLFHLFFTCSILLGTISTVIVATEAHHSIMLVFRWAQEYGLPASWFHAAANASWPSTMPEGQAVNAVTAWPCLSWYLLMKWFVYAVLLLELQFLCW